MVRVSRQLSTLEAACLFSSTKRSSWWPKSRSCGATDLLSSSFHNIQVTRNEFSIMCRVLPTLLLLLVAVNQLVEGRYVRILEDDDHDSDAPSSSDEDNNETSDDHKSNSIFDNCAVVIVLAVVGVVLAIAGVILIVVRRRRRRALERNSSTSPQLSPAPPVGVVYARH
ncbi:hypothetical protein L915_16872 [Phytophthora nicotianae]|nr:hypothetical protein L915_16872 [Phytophthora nicotianae]